MSVGSFYGKDEVCFVCKQNNKKKWGAKKKHFGSDILMTRIVVRKERMVNCAQRETMYMY